MANVGDCGKKFGKKVRLHLVGIGVGVGFASRRVMRFNAGNGLGRSMDSNDRLIVCMGPRCEISGSLYPDGIIALTAISRPTTRERGQGDSCSARARARRRRPIACKNCSIDWKERTRASANKVIYSVKSPRRFMGRRSIPALCDLSLMLSLDEAFLDQSLPSLFNRI